MKGLVADTSLALQNRSFRWVIVGFVIIIVAFGAAGALNMYMLTFFWAFDASGITAVLIAGPIGSMFGYASARWFYTVLDKKQGVLAGTGIWLGSHFLSVPLYLAGWLPAAGTPGLLVAIIVLGMISAFGIAQLLVGVGTMLADVADEHELESGRRQEGIFFGAVSLTSKSSAALGSLFGGVVLDLISWPTGEVVRTAADIPWDTLRSLGVIWGPISVLLAVPGLWFINRYGLDRERHRDILRRLAERHDREPAGREGVAETSKSPAIGELGIATGD